MSQSFFPDTCRNIEFVIRVIYIFDKRWMRIYDIQSFKRFLDGCISNRIHIFKRRKIGRLNNCGFIYITTSCSGYAPSSGLFAFTFAFASFGLRCRCRCRLLPPNHRSLLVNIHSFHVVDNETVSRFLNITDLCHININMFDGLVNVSPVQLGPWISTAAMYALKK